MVCGELPQPTQRAAQFDLKRVNGGLLVQNQDLGMIDKSDLKVVTERVPSDAELDDLLFAWKVAKYVKSMPLFMPKIIKPLAWVQVK